MNRILTYLNNRQQGDECPCCAARREYARLKKLCEQIETDSGGAIEFIIPSVNKLSGRNIAGEIDEDEADLLCDPASIQFYPEIEARKASLTEDLTRYTVDELRRMSAELLVAANAVEAAASGGMEAVK